MTSQFTQRRECRAAAFQYLYAWSVNQPARGHALRSHLRQTVEYFFRYLASSSVLMSRSAVDRMSSSLMTS